MRACVCVCCVYFRVSVRMFAPVCACIHASVYVCVRVCVGERGGVCVCVCSVRGCRSGCE